MIAENWQNFHMFSDFSTIFPMFPIFPYLVVNAAQNNPKKMHWIFIKSRRTTVYRIQNCENCKTAWIAWAWVAWACSTNIKSNKLDRYRGRAHKKNMNLISLFDYLPMFLGRPKWEIHQDFRMKLPELFTGNCSFVSETLHFPI